MAAYSYHSPAMGGSGSSQVARSYRSQQQQHQNQQQQQYSYAQGSGASSSYPYAQHQQHLAQYPTKEMFYGGAEGGDDSTPAVNMAGFGARNFARQQEEARQRAEREQQRLEEQHRARIAEERYYRAKRASEDERLRWEEEQRVNREREEEEDRRRRKEDEEWNRRQDEMARQEEERRRQQQLARGMSSSSSPLARSVPFHNHSNSSTPSLREIRMRDAASRPASRTATLRSNASSDGFWNLGARCASSHGSSPSVSSSGGSSTHSRLRPIQQTPIRRTVYEDDYEEADEMEPDGFGGVKPKMPKLDRSSSYGHDELPLAKCASCGESLPFEELVGHVCMDRLDSPSISSGPPTPMLTPGIEMIRGASAPSRSPFFLEKYAQVVEQSSSPILQATALPATNSPVSREWSPSNGDGLGIAASNDTAKRVEELRKERIRKIEEQRAAKQALPPKAPPNSMDKLKTHTPGSLSSSSMSSTQSSLQSSSMSHTPKTPSTEGLTPSSSFESAKSNQSGRMQKKVDDIIRQARAERVKGNIAETPVKKSGIDIGAIESLAKDMQLDDATPRKLERAPPRPASSESTPRPSGLNITLASRSQRKAKKICSVCLQTFAKTQPMVEKNGKIFCIDDYAELYLEKCRKCTRPVRDVGVRSQDGALSGLYHRDCFSCFRCNAAFEDRTFYVFDNAPYCGKHYHYLNGTTCHSCKEGIEGQCRQLETGERFHPNCLRCQYDNGKEICKHTLTDYYVVKDKRLCEWHFEKVQNRMLGSGIGSQIAEAARLKASKRRTIFQNFEARKGKA